MANLRVYREELTTLGGTEHVKIYRAELTTVGGENAVLRIYRSSLRTIPTATAPANQINIEPGYPVTLTATDSGTVGSVRQWTQLTGVPVTLTGATTETITYIAPATLSGDTQTFSYVCDNSVAVTTSVTVLEVTERAVVGGVDVPTLWYST